MSQLNALQHWSGVCSEPAQMHCNTGLGKMHSPLFSSTLQNRHTTGLCHCNSTCGDLLFLQVCSEPGINQHCNAGLGKMHSPLFSSALQNRLTAGLCHCNYTSEGLLFIQLSIDPTLMHCSTALVKMQSPQLSAALRSMRCRLGASFFPQWAPACCCAALCSSTPLPSWARS